MKNRSVYFLILLVSFCSFSFSMAAEVSYPTKPIEILVGYAPGGGTDLGARMVAEHARKYLGQEVIIINKPGGAGRVAMTLLAKATPDGYTLGATTDSSIILTPHLEKVPYNPMKDFTFITQYGTLNNAFIVVKDSPFQSFRDLIEFARANPGKLTMGTSGAGTSGYIAITALNLLEDLKIKLVPFEGAAGVTAGLLGGHVMAAASGSSGVAPQLRAGKIRVLALVGPERIDEFPGAPSLRELGYPLLEFQSWYLIAGPKNLEKAIVKKLDSAFRKAMESPDYEKFVKDLVIRAKTPLSGDELTEGLKRRNAGNEELLKKLGMERKQ